eukprot:UN01132
MGILKSAVQLDEAIKYFRDANESSAWNQEEFNKICGIGFTMSADEIKSALTKIVNSFGDDEGHGDIWCDYEKFRAEAKFADHR